MNRIFCIVGKSCAGKDTIYARILGLNQPGLAPVIPYTTRPIRTGETDGRNYRFVTQEQLEDFEAQGLVLEKRVYHTTRGPWTYFTLRFELDRNRLIISTLEGARAFIRCYGPEAVHLVYLHADDRTRLLRCIERESLQPQPNYAEVCRRFLADEADFSPQRLEEFANLHTIDTGSAPEDCLEQWSALYNCPGGTLPPPPA